MLFVACRRLGSSLVVAVSIHDHEQEEPERQQQFDWLLTPAGYIFSKSRSILRPIQIERDQIPVVEILVVNIQSARQGKIQEQSIGRCEQIN
jgi:hypothetical protein